MSEKVLVIAAHPDDEVLGCGGALCRHADQGDEIGIIFLTNGEGARGEVVSGEAIEHRARSAEGAAKVLGARLLLHCDFADNALDGMPLLKIIQEVEDVALSFAPDVVYTHFVHDLNRDHRAARDVAMTIFRPQPESTVRVIYGFAVPSSTGWQGAAAPAFNPAHYCDIAAVHSRKMKALACYESEMRPPPHIRSMEAITALDTANGMMVGMDKAEAFVIERQIWR